MTDVSTRIMEDHPTSNGCSVYIGCTSLLKTLNLTNSIALLFWYKLNFKSAVMSITRRTHISKVSKL